MMARLIENQEKHAFSRLVTPAVDIFQNPDGYLIVADLPGVTKDVLDVTIEEGRLTREGPLGSGTFRRDFRLPRHVDPNAVTACFEHGVLTLTVPKTEAGRPRQVEIN